MQVSTTEIAFTDIPIIDLKDASDPAARPRIASLLCDACTRVGFFYVTNHGVPQDLIDGAIEEGKRFFALPLEDKLSIDVHKSPTYKGYTKLLAENNDPENRGDLHEAFNMGPEYAVDPAQPADTSGLSDSKNVWPEGLPGFREVVWKYYEAVVGLGRKLFPLFALALDLPETFFDDKIDQAAAIMRLLHYPPQTGPVDDRVLGIGAHTDWECFTILWQENNISALQVLNTAGKWVNATPIPGTFVLNIGDQLARWSNDVFKSTVHRAINRTGVERYSIPLFFGTNYDVPLEALPTCVSETNPAKYEVITAGAYVKSRMEDAYAKSKAY